MEKENCLNCEYLDINGFIFNGTKKPCDNYPKNLPSTKDVVEVYKCDKYTPAKGRVLKIPTPHSIQPPNIQAVPFSVMGFKPIPISSMQENIGALKRVVWKEGFFTGLMIGLLISITVIAIIGWIL